jgi:hypothetical protein
VTNAGPSSQSRKKKPTVKFPECPTLSVFRRFKAPVNRCAFRGSPYFILFYIARRKKWNVMADQAEATKSESASPTLGELLKQLRPMK